MAKSERYAMNYEKLMLIFIFFKMENYNKFIFWRI